MKKSILTTIIVACLLCACAKENKTVADDMSIEEGSTATIEEAAAEASSDLAKVSKKDIAEYNSYDELIDGEWREVYYYSDSESQKRELSEKEYNEKCDELDHKYNKQEMPLHLNVFMDEM